MTRPLATLYLLAAASTARADGFGTDVSVGYAAGALLGSWPDPGVSGSVVARYDAFLVDRSTEGPRLGASLWGSSTVWPLQAATEDDGSDTRTFPFGFTQAGILTVLRYGSSLPASGDFGFGFGRLDLTNYFGGPEVLPTFTLEAGLRQRTSDRAFVDWLIRGHWSTQRSPTDAAVLHEWWMVQLLVMPGLHLK